MVSHFLKAMWKRKTVFRFLTEEYLRRALPQVSGQILDLASGSGSYRRFFSAEAEVLRTDYRLHDDIEMVVDANQSLPFPEAQFEAVLLLNALYILEDPSAFFAESYRVLKPGGRLLVVSPFIANVMPEPHDYRRFTAEGLVRVGRGQGWREIHIHPIGERFTAAANLLDPVWRFALVKMAVYALAIALDRLIPARARKQHPCPLGYVVELSK